MSRTTIRTVLAFCMALSAAQQVAPILAQADVPARISRTQRRSRRRDDADSTRPDDPQVEPTLAEPTLSAAVVDCLLDVFDVRTGPVCGEVRRMDRPPVRTSRSPRLPSFPSSIRFKP